MNKKLLITGLTVVAVGATGYLGGAVYAAAGADGTDHPSIPAATTYKAALPDFTHLSNGGTVGGWRLDAPADERPDYVETRVDGKVGYLKVSEISDGFAFPTSDSAGPVDVTAELTKAKARENTLMIQPNAAGEVWAPVYDKDGTTVIGKRLMNPSRDSQAP